MVVEDERGRARLGGVAVLLRAVDPPTVVVGRDARRHREVAGEVEGDVDDTIRDGEFVCSSCHMAKRSSALADADEQLCRDCV